MSTELRVPSCECCLVSSKPKVQIIFRASVRPLDSSDSPLAARDDTFRGIARIAHQTAYTGVNRAPNLDPREPNTEYRAPRGAYFFRLRAVDVRLDFDAGFLPTI